MPVTDISAATQLLDDFKQKLEALNSSPNTAALAQGPGEGSEPGSAYTRGLISLDDKVELMRELRKLDERQLHAAFYKQAAKKNMGVPIDIWMSAGGQSVFEAVSRNPDLQKMLDSSGGSALIRQDLEPIMYELFVRAFPAFDRFDKEPANGLVHTWTTNTDYGEAEFMSELGTVTDDRGTYVRETTNIAVIATRRGVSLKNQFAALQSGSGFNPERSELRNGLISVRAKMQRTIFQGNAETTESGGTANDEAGAYDADGFTGLRQILNSARVKNVDPATNPTTTGAIRAAVERALVEIGDLGGTVSVAYATYTDKATFDIQQDDRVRYDPANQVDVAVGVKTGGFNTVFGLVPMVGVPGPSIGTYTTDSADGEFEGGETVSDIYLLDEATISMPYLGSEGPSVIEIPMGVTGQLTRLFIIFGMWGLAVKAPTFSNKVRVQQPA